MLAQGKRPQILVIGYGEELCTPRAYQLAYLVGQEVAKAGAILITGGLGGVMEGASKGAREAGGTTISIIPHDESFKANPYSDVVIPTGLGHARDFLTAYSADGVIIVGGGVGTLIEAAIAYMRGKPIVALKGSGGVADELIGRYLDERRLVRIEGEGEPSEAVKRLLSLMRKKESKSSNEPSA